MSEEKKSSKAVDPTDVARQLQTRITTVATLPKGLYKMKEGLKTEAKKTETSPATETHESQ